MKRHHFERHFFTRLGCLRAAVLGANDGIISLSSLLVGVAATHVSRSQALVVGVAGLVGGAMSMAAGEFVSVSWWADSERSDLERERRGAAAADGADQSGPHADAGHRRQLAAVPGAARRPGGTCWRGPDRCRYRACHLLGGAGDGGDGSRGQRVWR